MPRLPNNCCYDVVHGGSEGLPGLIDVVVKLGLGLAVRGTHNQ